MTYYLDSSIIVSIFSHTGDELAAKVNSIPRKDIKIPSMVKGELLVGANKNKRKMEAVTRFLAAFEIMPFDDSASEIYGRIRAELEIKGKTIGPNDMVIAATALSYGGILVTSDTKEFKHVEGLRIEDWCA